MPDIYPTAGNNAVALEKPTSEISQEINIMEMTIGDIENAFSALASKLDPLLPAPAKGAAVPGSSNSPRQSPLGNTLASYNGRLNRVLDCLHMLRNDLHI